MQEDAIGYAGGGNLYAYVSGDVLQARDTDGLIKDATWATAGWDVMCLSLDACPDATGALRRLAGGGTWGERQAAGLQRWGLAAEWKFNVWVSYKDYVARFNAEKQRVSATTGMDDRSVALRMVYSSAARPISSSSFTKVFLAFFGFPLSGDLVAMGKTISARLNVGAVFVNDDFIDYMNSGSLPNDQKWAYTNAEFTVLRSDAESDIVWAVMHETLHLDPEYWIPFGTDPAARDMIEAATNARVSELLERAAPYPGFPPIVR